MPEGEEGIIWYCAEAGSPSPTVCSTRDQFQARLDTFFHDLIQAQGWPDPEAALLTAAVGEIGNNCFDHNLGQWQDEPGCWFSWENLPPGKKIVCVIADRGQGVLSSLKRVLPRLQGEEEALQVAFEKRISGRSPEQRGNGLKFVRSLFNEKKERGLLFFSGTAFQKFGGHDEIEKLTPWSKIARKGGTGTLALILWQIPQELK